MQKEVSVVCTFYGMIFLILVLCEKHCCYLKFYSQQSDTTYKKMVEK